MFLDILLLFYLVTVFIGKIDLFSIQSSLYSLSSIYLISYRISFPNVSVVLWRCKIIKKLQQNKS